jgi:hypothetical protein
MLLVINFSLNWQSFIKVANQIAIAQNENTDETFVLSILPRTGAKTTNLPNSSPLSLTNVETEPPAVIKLGYQQTDDYNRVGEQLLSVAGLDSPDRGWQDKGTVVIIPPNNPVLAAFLAHAIVHYLSDAWSPLWLVTNSNPLQMTEWD